MGLMESTISVDDIRKFAKKIVLKRLFMKTHIAVFVAVNLLLFFLNNPKIIVLEELQWWPWVTTGWGIALSYHIFWFIKENMASLFDVHLFSFIIINLYLFFVNWYIESKITWASIPALFWGLAIIVHYSLIKEINNEKIKSQIIGYLISDQSGRILISSENDNSAIKNNIGLSELKVEMIPMFFSALQSFTEEINLKGCNQLELNGLNLKVLSVNQENYTIAGFISPKMNNFEAKKIFENIIREFLEENKEKMEAWEKTGDSSLFKNWKPKSFKS